MNDYHPPKDFSGSYQPAAPRPRFPFVLFAVGTIVVAVIGFSLLAVVSIPSMRSRGMPVAPRAPLQQVALSDGTILYLEDITFGTQHQLPVSVRSDQAWNANGSARVLTAGTSIETLVFPTPSGHGRVPGF
jgi:hypothetical protein